MTPERLELLAAAWGADLRRWPAAERVAAQALMSQDLGAQVFLERGAELDALLDTHTVAAPDARLADAVLAGSPAGRDSHRSGARHRRQPGLPQRRWWWSGAGVAGVGMAGTAFGEIAVAMALSIASGSSALKLTPASPTLHGGWAATAFDAANTVDGSDE